MIPSPSTTMIPRSPIGRVLLVLALAGCSSAKTDTEQARTTAEKARGAGTDMTGMTDMPGMSGDSTADSTGALPTVVTLSAAKIKHGGITWGNVSVGASSSGATLPAEVIPDEDRTSRLGAPATGRVLTVSVRPGDHVIAGQPLVTLVSQEASAAQSDVAKGESELTSRRAAAQYAAAARARAERLLALKAIPRQEYERAAADDEQAAAAVAQAETELRRARTMTEQLGAVASKNGEIVLRAPAHGVVLERLALPGSVVNIGAPLVVISDVSHLWLSINAPELFASSFRKGAQLRFTVAAFPSDTFQARIDAVGAGLDATTRTLSVRGGIANAGLLKPQMLATVMLGDIATTDGVVIPDAAVQLMQGKSYVFVATADGAGGARFTRRQVVIGSRGAGYVPVLKGLAIHDVIVLSGAFAVKAEFQKSSMPKMEM